MTDISLPGDYTNGTTASGTEVQTDFNAIETFLNTTGVHVYQAGTVAAAAIAANAVVAGKIAAGTIVDADISATAEIAVAKLADGAAYDVLQTNSDGTTVAWVSGLTANHLASDAVTTAKIAAGAVTFAKLADDAVAPRNVTRVAAAHTSNTTLTPASGSFGGATLSSGEVVLLAAQTTTSQNGPWTFNGNSVLMTRPSWYDDDATDLDAFEGMEVTSLRGDYAGRTWRLTTTGAVTVDTTNTAWQMVRYSAYGLDADKPSATLVASGGIYNAHDSGLLKSSDGSAWQTVALAAAGVADDSVTTSKIQDSAVTSAKIADGTIVDADISATAEIAVAKLADGAAYDVLQTNSDGTTVAWVSGLTANHLASDAVTTAKILDANVTTAKIADSAVTSAKIADGTIATADIADSAITSAKIADGTIAAGDIASDAVTTAKILDSNVTAAKLAADAVTTAKILDSNVTTAKIADSAVTSAKIADATIVVGDIAQSVWSTGVHLSGTYASLPAAASGNAGYLYYATDVHALYRSTGSAWVRMTTPAGVITPYAGSTAPTGYVLCDGTSYLRTGIYAELFTAISTTFGAVDGTHFSVPDLRGRVAVGLDNLGGSDAGRLSASNTLGGAGGTETHQLSISEMPVHSHDSTSTASTHGGSLTTGSTTATMQTGGAHSHETFGTSVYRQSRPAGNDGTGTFLKVTATDSPTVYDPNTDTHAGHTHTMNSHHHALVAQGEGTAHNNMQPYMLTGYIIKL